MFLLACVLSLNVLELTVLMCNFSSLSVVVLGADSMYTLRRRLGDISASFGHRPTVLTGSRRARPDACVFFCFIARKTLQSEMLRTAGAQFVHFCGGVVIV